MGARVAWSALGAPEDRSTTALSARHRLYSTCHPLSGTGLSSTTAPEEVDAEVLEVGGECNTTQRSTTSNRLSRPGPTPGRRRVRLSALVESVKIGLDCRVTDEEGILDSAALHVKDIDHAVFQPSVAELSGSRL